MNIVELLLLKYPDIDFLKDVILRDEGEGVYIAEWNLEDPQPSLEELQEWKQDPVVVKQYEYENNKQINKEIYDKLDEIDKKSIRALRTNDTNRITALESQAVDLRKQLLPEK